MASGLISPLGIILFGILVGIPLFLYISYIQGIRDSYKEENDRLERILAHDLIKRVLEVYVKQAEVDPIKKSMFTKEELDFIITLINKKN